MKKPNAHHWRRPLQTAVAKDCNVTHYKGVFLGLPLYAEVPNPRS